MATETLVFVHGSGDSAAVWAPLMALQSVPQAVALELPGHGAMVDHPGPAEMSVEDYAAYVRDALKKLRVPQPTLVGHSLGGAIALRLTLDAPELVGRLALVGSGARLRVSPAFLEAARAAGSTGVPAITQMAFAEQHAEEAAEYHARRAPTYPGVLYRDLAACNQFDVMGEVARIRQPTLLIVGESDRMTPPKYSEYLVAQIPNAELAVIPEAGHYVQIEQAQRVADALRAWLDLTP